MTLIDKAEALAAIEAWFAETKSFAPPSLLEAISALPARGVGVRHLVWLAKSKWHHVAENPFGECWIKHYNGMGGLWTLYGPGHYGPNNNFPTLDAAKAAAQRDYEARILAALEPALAHTDAAQAREAALNAIKSGFWSAAPGEWCVSDIERVTDAILRAMEGRE